MNKTLALIAAAATFSFACAAYAGSDDGAVNNSQPVKQTSSQQAPAPAPAAAQQDNGDNACCLPKEKDYRFLGGHA